MKKEGIVILFLVVLIVNLYSVSAGFSLGNESYSIDKIYSPETIIKGWINISFIDEKTNSIFQDLFGNSIELIKLLKNNSEFNYTCSTNDCLPDYTTNNEETEKILSLQSGESKIIGFKFTGNLVGIGSIKFEIDSNAPTSCKNQLKLDILNDGTIDIGNDKSSGSSCSSKNYGCFKSNEAIEQYTIDSTLYCQKIKLSEAPGFEIGAWVKKGGTSKNITMTLFDWDGVEVVNCILPEAQTSGGEVSCEVSYLVTESKDHYVCINSNNGGDYKLQGNTNPTNGCGFRGNPIQSNTPAAYDIFASGMEFDSVGLLEVKNLLQGGGYFDEKVNSYIINKYGSLDCTNDCIIPIKIISGANQGITLSGLVAEYEKNTGLTQTNIFYNLEETPALINSDYQKLTFDYFNFLLPNEFGNKTFLLKLDGTEVFSEQIFIERMPQIISVYPTIVIAAYPTKFTASITDSGSGANVTKYEWDFGDGKTASTTEDSVTHTYNATGTFELKIKITDSKSRNSEKTFNINVETPKEAVNSTLKYKIDSLKNIKIQINNFPAFYQKSLEPIIDINKFENDVKKIQINLKIASTDNDYISIMNKLLDLRIPQSIIFSKSADNFQFYPEKKNVNLAILKEIGGGNYNSSDKEKYINAIYAWNEENMEIRISFKELTANYEDGPESILNVFELNIKELNQLTYDSHFILKNLENLKFETSYSEKQVSGYTEISIKESEKTIIFSTTEDISFSDLPMFISPEIDRLVIMGEICSPKCKPNETCINRICEKENNTPKWILFILIILLLMVIGFIAYVIVQEWYKRKYESYLFKNRNELFNLIAYIENSRKKEMSNGEIISKLKKAGWNSEQIRYALRKHSGKRTGMFEIPVDKILNKFKKKSTLLPGKIPINRNPHPRPRIIKNKKMLRR